MGMGNTWGMKKLYMQTTDKCSCQGNGMGKKAILTKKFSSNIVRK